jgi:hypothetical protein
MSWEEREKRRMHTIFRCGSPQALKLSPFDLTTCTTLADKMLTVTALLLALNAAAPASALYERLGRMTIPEATSPAKARFRAAREAAPEPTSAPEYPDFGSMPLMKRDVGTDTCGFHTDDGETI